MPNFARITFKRIEAVRRALQKGKTLTLLKSTRTEENAPVRELDIGFMVREQSEHQAGEKFLLFEIAEIAEPGWVDADTLREVTAVRWENRIYQVTHPEHPVGTRRSWLFKASPTGEEMNG